MKAPFFSIITPTMLRPSLIQCCNSVKTQKGTRDLWEHIIIDDTGDLLNDPVKGSTKRIVLSTLVHEHKYLRCAKNHSNFGNTCRHDAWHVAKGTYLIYLDDDNYLAFDTVLQFMRAELIFRNFPKVVLFPIIRNNERFFDMPPRKDHVDTANLVVHRSIGQWPDGDEYSMDGTFIEQLTQNHPYVEAHEFQPIIVNTGQNLGKDF